MGRELSQDAGRAGHVNRATTPQEVGVSSTEMTVSWTWCDHQPSVLTASRWRGSPSLPSGRTHPSSPSVSGSPQSERYCSTGTGTRVVSLRRARSAASESRCGPVEYLWGWSCVDGRVHAVDPGVERLALVYLARCGHRLLRRATLPEVPPARRCPACGEGISR
jgi:hypothetical protein